MSAQYQRFLKVLEKWPLDKSKSGRDLGEHLRKHVQNLVNPAAVGSGDDCEKLNKQIDALERLSNNNCGKNYKRKFNSTATGLTAEQCSQVLSSEFLQYLNEEKSIFNRKTTNTQNVSHVPVLCDLAVSYLDPSADRVFIDTTFGAGGHTRTILNSSANVKVFALDRDPIAHERAQEMSKEYPHRLIPMMGKFSDLPKLLKAQGVSVGSVDGILFDFGCSSMQFDEADRGFSISKNGPLDMRMDKGRYDDQITAADVVAKADESDLVRILRVYGEEKAAKKIARAIVEARSAFYKIETTKQLADLVASCMMDSYRLDKMQRPVHVATKTFQALRIFVNNELNEINYGMILANKYLKKDGRLVTITFHSLEDTIVKRHINGNVIEGLANPVPLKYSGHDFMHDKELVESLVESNWKQMHKHVIVPSDEEIQQNSRSRSAKLRAAVKVK